MFCSSCHNWFIALINTFDCLLISSYTVILLHFITHSAIALVSLSVRSLLSLLIIFIWLNWYVISTKFNLHACRVLWEQLLSTGCRQRNHRACILRRCFVNSDTSRRVNDLFKRVATHLIYIVRRNRVRNLFLFYKSAFSS